MLKEKKLPAKLQIPKVNSGNFVLCIPNYKHPVYSCDNITYTFQRAHIAALSVCMCVYTVHARAG